MFYDVTPRAFDWVFRTLNNVTHGKAEISTMNLFGVEILLVSHSLGLQRFKKLGPGSIFARKRYENWMESTKGDSIWHPRCNICTKEYQVFCTNISTGDEKSFSYHEITIWWQVPLKSSAVILESAILSISTAQFQNTFLHVLTVKIVYVRRYLEMSGFVILSFFIFYFWIGNE